MPTLYPPGPDQPIVDEEGRPTRTLARFMAALAQQPGPIVVLTPGPSPWIYSAPGRGHVVLSGGTVSAVSIARGTNPSVMVPAGVTSGPVPVMTGDRVGITYTGAAPGAAFIPGGPG